MRPRENIFKKLIFTIMEDIYLATLLLLTIEIRLIFHTNYP
jgi:hypothetical protein